MGVAAVNGNIFDSVGQRAFGEKDADESWIKQQQLASYFTFLPASVTGNVANALIVLALFRESFGLFWGAMTTVIALSMAGVRLSGWNRYKREGVPNNTEDRVVRTIKIQSAANGAIWGITLLVLTLTNDRQSGAFLGMVAAGMMCAGAVSFSAIPAAGRLFITVIGSCMLVAFVVSGNAMGYAAAALLASYAFILDKAVRLSFSNFIARIVREQQLSESSETVSMLLNELEENGSDWLWEIDKDGRIVSPSGRFADAAQRPAETLCDTRLLELFDRTPELKTLRDHVRHVRSFRDLSLELTINGEKRWWLLSGRAIRNEAGEMQTLRGVATDISATKLAQSQVAYLAHYDGLTDLPNRFLFNETINRALNRRAESEHVAILSIDLDHFKAVNDTLGHPAGDQLLKLVSRRIENCLAPEHMVARLGGDEFAVLLPGVTSPDAPAALAERIIKELCEPMMVDQQQVLCGCSIGIASAPADGCSVDILMKHVDLALYEAKANGRNRHATFERGMDEAAKVRREIELDLRAAITRNEFALHYQPLVDIETEVPNGYEALLRWHHPERGLVMPAEFVYIAEETGLIVQLGEWVLRNAIAELANWPEHLSVSVNLSPAQMKSASLISTIVNALARHQVDPKRLELEITEGVLMHESEVNLATLHRLRSLGIRIALDDFGTGYSSLNYLRSFPFDKIKIDRCFIENVDTREDCQAIVRAITSLASSLGMATTAEGVENDAQRAQLKLDGCSELQGFLFSKALPAAELTNLRGKASAATTETIVPFLPPAELGDLSEVKGRMAG